MITQLESDKEIAGKHQSEAAHSVVPLSPIRPFIRYSTPEERVVAFERWIAAAPKRSPANISDESLRRQYLYEDRA